MRAALRTVFAVAVLACAVPARAQMDSREAIMLQNQILELRRDMQMLQSQRGGYPAPPPVYRDRGPPMAGGGELAAQLLDRVQTLEDEVRRLRGQLDEQTNAARRSHEDLAKQIADLSFRLQNAAAAPPARTPEARGPELRGPEPRGAEQGPAPAGPGRRPPELAMQEGNAALARRDYPAAEAAAREVLSAGRGGPRAADANFLLAQSLMGERNYQGAAVAYDDAYKRNPSGSRAPEALLGLAGALNGLGERPAACATLDKLRAEFPSLRSDVREGVVSLRARSLCR